MHTIPWKIFWIVRWGGEDLVRKSHNDIKMDGAKLAEGWFTQQILD